MYIVASVYHVISDEVKNHILRDNWVYRYTFINNPHWQSSGIIFFCKYYIVISDTLVGSFLDVLFLLVAVILSGLHEKQPRRNKDWVTEKST